MQVDGISPISYYAVTRTMSDFDHQGHAVVLMESRAGLIILDTRNQKVRAHYHDYAFSCRSCLAILQFAYAYAISYHNQVMFSGLSGFSRLPSSPTL
jgi:hypothetical protein